MTKFFLCETVHMLEIREYYDEEWRTQDLPRDKPSQKRRNKWCSSGYSTAFQDGERALIAQRFLGNFELLNHSPKFGG